MAENAGSLVIGGTGMLAGATRWLAQNYPPTLLVARRASAFARDNPDIVPLDLDWHTADFVERIATAIPPSVPSGRALVWVHEPARLLPGLLKILPTHGTVIVLGSGDSRHTLKVDLPDAAVVRLGSKLASDGTRRWLTNDEISEGVVAAIRDGWSRVLGEIVPAG